MSSYTAVAHEDHPRASLEKHLPQDRTELSEHASSPRTRTYWLLINVAVMCLSALFFALSFRRDDLACAKQLSVYSPALEAVQYRTTIFNGTFGLDSVYRGPPSPDIDAAWERISTRPKPIRIARDTLARIGKAETPSMVRFREADGGGYMGAVEVMHQLHCLNYLRKATYREYYEVSDDAFQVKPETVRDHLDHCVEILRQNLMCTGDVGLITYDWVAGFSAPYPNFNTQHKCRDFERILTWNEEHGLELLSSHVVRFGEEVDLQHTP